MRKDKIQEDEKYAFINKAGEDLLKINMKAFEYGSDTGFVENLQENYFWIKRADSLKKVYESAAKDKLSVSTGKLERRLALLAEIKADYDQRIAMINSPFYALCSNEDFSRYSEETLRNYEESVREDKPELAAYLKNYRLLAENDKGFKKGSAVRE